MPTMEGLVLEQHLVSFTPPWCVDPEMGVLVLPLSQGWNSLCRADVDQPQTAASLLQDKEDGALTLPVPSATSEVIIEMEILIFLLLCCL